MSLTCSFLCDGNVHIIVMIIMTICVLNKHVLIMRDEKEGRKKQDYTHLL